MATVKLEIDGMHCGACVRRVTAALAKTPGVQVVSVSIGSATVSLDDTTPGTVIGALQQAGYPARESV